MRVLTIDLDWLMKLDQARMMEFEQDDLPNLTVNQFWQVIAWCNKMHPSEFVRDENKAKQLASFARQVALQSPQALVKVITNHHEVYPILNTMEALEITNIDLHHDILYRDRLQEEVDCGNWMYHLMRQGKVKSYNWIRRGCSSLVNKSIFNPEKYCKYNSQFGMPKELEYDYIFIIKSPYYTPPSIVKYAETFEMYIRSYQLQAEEVDKNEPQ